MSELQESIRMSRTIRLLREDAGESLSQAAKAIGCTKGHLWELEVGRSDNPTLAILRGLSRHYRVTVAKIIGEA